MTAIVTLEGPEGSWIGADSFYGTEMDRNLLHAETPKLFELGDFIFGVSGSLRLAQVIRYGAALPPRKMEIVNSEVVQEVAAAYIYRVVEAVRLALKETEHQGQINGVEGSMPMGGMAEVLFLYEGLAYRITGAFSFDRDTRGYQAAGSGALYMLGALAVLPKDELGQFRVERALAAAEAHCPTVAGPVDIRFQKKPTGDSK